MFSRKILVRKLHVFSRKVLRYNGSNASPARKNKVNAKVVLWSELDENLLGEIMSRLSPTDQARFHAVCKRWHSVRPITTYTWLPWFVSIKDNIPLWSNSLKYRLYEPYSSPRSRISTHKISLSKFSIPYSLPTIMFYIIEFRHNWLFASFFQRNCRTYSFVFSPLTRKFIQLPKLDYQLPKSWSSINITFSTNPDSPDCVFFISIACDEPEFIVMTCCQGDEEWTVKIFDNSVRGLYLAEYINGTFFVVYRSGELVSYNIMNGEFKIEKLDRDDDLDQQLLYNSQMEFLVFELNGELIILYIGFRNDHVRGDNTTFPGIPCIKKFDRPTKAWIPPRSLGDQTIFVGHRIYSIVKVGMEQARNMGVLSNAIYYYFDLGCIIYSFENGVLVQLKYNPASKTTVKSGDSLQFQCNSAIRDTKNILCWLEPPVIC